MDNSERFKLISLPIYFILLQQSCHLFLKAPTLSCPQIMILCDSHIFCHCSIIFTVCLCASSLNWKRASLRSKWLVYQVLFFSNVFLQSFWRPLHRILIISMSCSLFCDILMISLFQYLLFPHGIYMWYYCFM